LHRRERDVLVRLEDVDQVVWNAPAFGLCRLGDTNVEPAVEVARVGVDDLAVDELAEVNGAGGLADAGWPVNGDQRRLWCGEPGGDQ
jgi:hypothetical protein